MNSQDFLTLNLVGAGAFIVWYVVARGGSRRPTQLNLKAKDSAPLLMNPSSEQAGAADNVVLMRSAQSSKLRTAAENTGSQVTVTEVTVSQVSASQVKVSQVTVTQVHPDLVGVKTKSLNIMFNYNGHSWDAYEVLGVPAGASITIVTEAYQAALLRGNKSSLDFLETAYKAILNRVG